MRTAALVVLSILLAGVAPFGAGAAGPAEPVAFTASDAIGEAPPAAVTNTASSSNSHALHPPHRAATTFQQSTGDWTADTVITVELHRNGNARWGITFSYTLENENETAAFRRYAEAFEAGEAGPGLNADFFRRVAESAAAVADRQMRIRNVTRSARITNDTGTLTLSFVWTNMLGHTESGHLRLRDAFLLPGGRTWLGTLEAGQRLVVQTPPGYTVSSASTQVIPRNESIIIPGPRDFSVDDPLTIIYKRAETEPTTATTTPPERSEVPWDVFFGGLVAIAIIGSLLAAGQFVRRRDTSATGSAEEAEAETGETREPPEEATAETAAEVERAEEEDLSLLSDEERVERLLERHGGRMKQATIVDETGWSDAKVSQLLSSMADEGRIEKLRIGRENLISLPEYEGEDESED